MAEQANFKRINFFKGFLTTEKDWNDAERYHIDKRRLHARMLHSPGIVFGYNGDLRVTSRARGDRHREGQPQQVLEIAIPAHRPLFAVEHLSSAIHQTRQDFGAADVETDRRRHRAHSFRPKLATLLMK